MLKLSLNGILYIFATDEDVKEFWRTYEQY